MLTSINELNIKAKAARKAARDLANITGQVKNQALLNIAETLISSNHEILKANEEDYEKGKSDGISEVLLDRLLLDNERLKLLASDVRAVSNLPDPVGETMDMRTMPNGLQVSKRRVPLGVIGAIYESRPNVTVDISVLCLKSGNAVILRGGKESIHTNKALVKVIRDSVLCAGIPENTVQFIESTDREIVGRMLKMKDEIDLIIPRGGANLIHRVSEESTIPAITGGIGVCHTYVDRSANIDMALDIVFNAKVQRPSVCNALDTLIVHSDIASEYLPRIGKMWLDAGVEMRCDPASMDILSSVVGPSAIPAGQEDWGTEYLSLKASIKIVASIDEVINHIETFGTGHSEAIVTEDYSSAMKFLNEIDSSAVMVNASTRFNDGGEFGLGAEVAISTSKFPVRGPMGLRELTSYKWIVLGAGHVRE